MLGLKGAAIGVLWRLAKALKGFRVTRIGSLRILEIARLSPQSFPRRAEFFPAEKAIRAPNVPGQPIPDNDYYPGLGYRQLFDALITSNRRVPQVCVEDAFLVPEAAHAGPWNIRVGEPTVGGILRQDESALLVNVRKSRAEIPRGIFVGSWSPHNWFHWLIDTLPSVYMAGFLPAKFDNYPLVLPDKGVIKRSWLEPLELVRNQRELVYISESKHSKVRDLVWIDSPSCPGPLPLEPNDFPNFRIHGSALRAYRRHILQQLGIDGPRPAPSKKIFLARKQGGNRPYNQEELLAVAEDYGFEPVFLEDLRFKESVEIMLDAEHVIGPHGAGWANALFCQKGARASMWTWPDSKNDNWFANISAIQKMDFLTTLEVRDRGTEKWLSPNSLRSLLEQRNSGCEGTVG